MSAVLSSFAGRFRTCGVTGLKVNRDSELLIQANAVVAVVAMLLGALAAIGLPIGSVFLTKPHIDSKRMRALAVSSLERSPGGSSSTSRPNARTRSPPSPSARGSAR